MKTTELRLGNYIATEYLNKSTFKVISIHSDRIYFESVRENFKSDTIQNYIKPIPLTEEWLLRLGFESTNTYYFSKCNLHLQGDIRGFHLVISRIDGIKVKYVHQLQNLYFALTGEELTI